MRKIRLLSVLLLIVSFAFSQTKEISKLSCRVETQEDSKNTKQLWAEIGGNFIATDINGVEHNLQTYLDDGKTVIIDFSAVWCSPCKTLHESGVFDELYYTYGPEGTGELVVLWVEVGGASIEELEGDNPLNYDWTVGGTWPVPIISSTEVLDPTFSELYQGYVPTVFMVCPSGYYKSVTSEAWAGATAVYEQVGNCPITGDVPIAEIAGNTAGYLYEALSYENVGASVDPITEYAWTFENATPATSDEANPSAVWTTAGEHTVTLIVTNINGPSEEVDIVVTIIDDSNLSDLFVTFEEIIVEENFPSDLTPYSWTTFDNDGGTVWIEYADFGVYGDDNSFNVYSNSVANGHVNDVFDPYGGDKCAIAVTNNPDAGTGVSNDDWLISPQISLGTGSNIELYVLSVKDTWGLEEYNIAVSTTDNSPESFSIVGGELEAAATWELVTVDLSDYDGLDVYIAINHTDHDHYALAVDNITINTITGIDEIYYKTKIYPNPANDIVNIYNAEKANIRIFDIAGKLVLSKNNISRKQSINVSNLNNGTYFIKLNQNNTVETKKIVILK